MTNSSITIFCDVLGWVYFLCWSVSFYPQVLLNYRTKSVSGLSFEFLFYNITGYLFYSVYTITTYVQQKQNNQPMSIEPNDIAFVVHAVILTIITIIQCLIYRTERETINRIHAYIGSLLWVLLFYSLALCAANVLPWSSSSSSSYSLIGYLGYVKVFVSFVKYVPQAVKNYRRQSTTGWSETGVLLDFSGGILSFMQQFLSAYNSEDWGILTSNLPKLLLAIESVAFDVLFIFQHYCLYTHRGRGTGTGTGGERRRGSGSGSGSGDGLGDGSGGHYIKHINVGNGEGRVGGREQYIYDNRLNVDIDPSLSSLLPAPSAPSPSPPAAAAASSAFMFSNHDNDGYSIQ